MQYNPYTPATSNNYKIEKKKEKCKNIYDELCKKYGKYGCLNLLLALAFFLPDRPAGDLPGA